MGATKSTPCFLAFILHDRDILTGMVDCESASEIRTKLNIYFAAQARAEVSKLKIMLQNIKKGSSAINEYFSKIKNAVDRSASIGPSVSESNHIEAIFNGLPEDYDTLHPKVPRWNS